METKEKPTAPHLRLMELISTKILNNEAVLHQMCLRGVSKTHLERIVQRGWGDVGTIARYASVIEEGIGENINEMLAGYARSQIWGDDDPLASFSYSDVLKFISEHYNRKSLEEREKIHKRLQTKSQIYRRLNGTGRFSIRSLIACYQWIAEVLEIPVPVKSNVVTTSADVDAVDIALQESFAELLTLKITPASPAGEGCYLRAKLRLRIDPEVEILPEIPTYGHFLGLISALIRRMPNESVARIFGVTQEAIRRWNLRQAFPKDNALVNALALLAKRLGRPTADISVQLSSDLPVRPDRSKSEVQSEPKAIIASVAEDNPAVVLDEKEIKEPTESAPEMVTPLMTARPLSEKESPTLADGLVLVSVTDTDKPPRADQPLTAENLSQPEKPLVESEEAAVHVAHEFQMPAPTEEEENEALLDDLNGILHVVIRRICRQVRRSKTVTNGHRLGYLDEIITFCRGLGIDAEFMDRIRALKPITVEEARTLGFLSAELLERNPVTRTSKKSNNSVPRKKIINIEGNFRNPEKKEKEND